MNDRTAYTGIDEFRLAAALLVITIHTSPLASCSETGDFFLTRVIARVAVPFFLMASGFFLISQYARDAGRLWAFLKKTAVLYGISIAVYLPLNLYNGYFSGKHFLPELIKDLIFDGTMYHLWYLPASMLGAGIAWYAVRRLGFKKALIVTLGLYAAGLLGDSYYGIAEKLPILSVFYQNLFEITDYTRNGIFFAPVFLVMGGMAAEEAARGESLSLQICGAGLGVSFLLMSCEGLLLRELGIQRHDSMYLFLLPCMYFLFRLLLFRRGSRKERIRTWALLIYIIHPMMIVGVRLLAKLTGLESLLIQNSLVHFLAVSALSVGCGILAAECCGALYGKKKRGGRCSAMRGKDRAWIELDQDSLRHNVNEFRNAMRPGCELMAVMKAEAYGHGMYEAAVCVSRMGVNAFAVASVEEGIRLRRFGISGEILILGYTDPERAKELCRYDLTQTLIDYPYARLLNQQHKAVKVHVKVDTGMHRLGFGKGEADRIAHVFSMKYLKVCGIYTHLCAADSLEAEDVRFTKQQIGSFYGLLEKLKERGIAIPKVHIQSSYGFLNYPELPCDYVRAGIALYGVLSAPGDRTRLELDLRPVLSLKSKVVLIRKIRTGESVGYGRAFTAERDSRIAVLPLGYGDGLPRNLSCGRTQAVIRGQRVPVIGRICMDQLMVDITDAHGIFVGDTATFIGWDGSMEATAPDLADQGGTITNELLSRLGGRLTRTARACFRTYTF
ncbi:serine racemase VanT catalytic subunit [Lachnospiraceae bacterium]|nr:serine racemase VanT catalytic subunit [Lachnospiraceae bacterium]